MPAYPGLIVNHSHWHWRWPERDLAGNATGFFIERELGRGPEAPVQEGEPRPLFTKP